ncbi:metallophosphoesterase [Thermosipho ferrireducens]|uniref:Phosphoesterase n=1 Tax=Thermosipho ferrireducens TaxID=2571116 RepID=A0ABX7S883_9BACT|nr:metallophosphoesterase [Thermosipho ferrireducens]QTA37486.1 metallophosphoesterase [Thermosipho ferrireducens]
MWLVVSDSHDNILKMKEIEKIIEKEKITTVFHCGDFVAPFVLPYLVKDGVNFFGVFGNNDGEKLLLFQKSNGRIRPGPLEITIGDYKIMMMHEPYALKSIEKSNIYDFVFFGHTHEIVERKEGDALIVNPGESSGWLTGVSTVALIEPLEKKAKIIKI